ncbi:MAG: hypothetical protein H6R01_457 [Burkholderiaceae bacterium]|nr:hypothetical protein [Burkholderiaceae bacterium]
MIYNPATVEAYREATSRQSMPGCKHASCRCAKCGTRLSSIYGTKMALIHPLSSKRVRVCADCAGEA